MNDINRRGFLGTLAAAITGLIGKRVEASANGEWGVCEDCGHPVLIEGTAEQQVQAYEDGFGIVETLEDGKVVKRQCIPCFQKANGWSAAARFQPGDVVWLLNPQGEYRAEGRLTAPCYGVVTSCWVTVGNSHRCMVNWCVAGEVFDADVWEEDLEPCGPLALFSHNGINVDRDMSPGGYLHIADDFVLCKPTQAVKAGQYLIYNRPIHPLDKAGRLPPVIEPFVKEWADRIALAHSTATNFRPLGFATKDCAPGEWVWCVPQVKTGTTYFVDPRTDLWSPGL